MRYAAGRRSLSILALRDFDGLTSSLLPARRGRRAGWRRFYRQPKIRARNWERTFCLNSAAARRLDRSDVYFPHFHHRIKRALGFVTTCRHCCGQHAGRNLPRMPHLSLHQPQALSWPPLPTMAFQ